MLESLALLGTEVHLLWSSPYPSTQLRPSLQWWVVICSEFVRIRCCANGWANSVGCSVWHCEESQKLAIVEKTCQDSPRNVMNDKWRLRDSRFASPCFPKPFGRSVEVKNPYGAPPQGQVLMYPGSRGHWFDLRITGLTHTIKYL